MKIKLSVRWRYDTLRGKKADVSKLALSIVLPCGDVVTEDMITNFLKLLEHRPHLKTVWKAF